MFYGRDTERRAWREVIRRDQEVIRGHDTQAQAGLSAITFLGGWLVFSAASPTSTLAVVHGVRHALLMIAAVALGVAMLCFVCALVPRAGLVAIAIARVRRRRVDRPVSLELPFAGLGVPSEELVRMSRRRSGSVALAADFQRVRRIKLHKHLFVLAGFVWTALGFGATIAAAVLP